MPLNLEKESLLRRKLCSSASLRNLQKSQLAGASGCQLGTQTYILTSVLSDTHKESAGLPAVQLPLQRVEPEHLDESHSGGLTNLFNHLGTPWTPYP